MYLPLTVQCRLKSEPDGERTEQFSILQTHDWWMCHCWETASCCMVLNVEEVAQVSEAQAASPAWHPWDHSRLSH